MSKKAEKADTDEEFALVNRRRSAPGLSAFREPYPLRSSGRRQSCGNTTNPPNISHNQRQQQQPPQRQQRQRKQEAVDQARLPEGDGRAQDLGDQPQVTQQSGGPPQLLDGQRQQQLNGSQVPIVDEGTPGTSRRVQELDNHPQGLSEQSQTSQLLGYQRQQQADANKARFLQVDDHATGHRSQALGDQSQVTEENPPPQQLQGQLPKQNNAQVQIFGRGAYALGSCVNQPQVTQQSGGPPQLLDAQRQQQLSGSQVPIVDEGAPGTSRRVQELDNHPQGLSEQSQTSQLLGHQRQQQVDANKARFLQVDDSATGHRSQALGDQSQVTEENPPPQQLQGQLPKQNNAHVEFFGRGAYALGSCVNQPQVTQQSGGLPQLLDGQRQQQLNGSQVPIVDEGAPGTSRRVQELDNHPQDLSEQSQTSQLLGHQRQQQADANKARFLQVDDSATGYRSQALGDKSQVTEQNPPPQHYQDQRSKQKNAQVPIFEGGAHALGSCLQEFSNQAQFAHQDLPPQLFDDQYQQQHQMDSNQARFLKVNARTTGPPTQALSDHPQVTVRDPNHQAQHQQQSAYNINSGSLNLTLQPTVFQAQGQHSRGIQRSQELFQHPQFVDNESRGQCTYAYFDPPQRQPLSLVNRNLDQADGQLSGQNMQMPQPPQQQCNAQPIKNSSVEGSYEKSLPRQIDGRSQDPYTQHTAWYQRGTQSEGVCSQLQNRYLRPPQLDGISEGQNQQPPIYQEYYNKQFMRHNFNNPADLMYPSSSFNNDQSLYRPNDQFALSNEAPLGEPMHSSSAQLHFQSCSQQQVEQHQYEQQYNQQWQQQLDHQVQQQSWQRDDYYSEDGSQLDWSDPEAHKKWLRDHGYEVQMSKDLKKNQWGHHTKNRWQPGKEYYQQRKGQKQWNHRDEGKKKAAAKSTNQKISPSDKNDENSLAKIVKEAVNEILLQQNSKAAQVTAAAPLTVPMSAALPTPVATPMALPIFAQTTMPQINTMPQQMPTMQYPTFFNPYYYK